MIWMFVVSAVWVLLGMFLEPAKVAPYASAILGLVGHISSLALGMKDFLNDCKLQVCQCGDLKLGLVCPYAHICMQQ